jgi:DNA-binding MarR family transcriptional regulator
MENSLSRNSIAHTVKPTPPESGSEANVGIDNESSYDEIRLHGVAHSYPSTSALVKALRGILEVLRPHFNGVQEFKGQGGLAPRHVHVMVQLAMSGAQSVSDLARQLSLTLASTSQAVGYLAESGLVVRQEDPLDHRRTLVTLSELAAASAKNIAVTRLAPLEHVLQSFDEDRIQALTQTLEEITKKLNAELQQNNTHSDPEQKEGRNGPASSQDPSSTVRPTLRFTESNYPLGGIVS